MALPWEDILKQTLKQLGKTDDVIEAAIKAARGGGDNVDDAAKAVKSVSAAAETAPKLTSVSDKAARKAANKAANKANQAVQAEKAMAARAEEGLKNASEFIERDEKIVEGIFSESGKTRLAEKGFEKQLDATFAKMNLDSSNKIEMVAEKRVAKKIEEAKAAGKTFTQPELEKLIKEEIAEVGNQFQQMAKSAEKGLTTRITNLKAMTPEQAKMSGARAGLDALDKKAIREGAGSARDKAMSVLDDKTLYPIKNAEGEQIFKEIGGRQVPQYETAAERAKRITADKKFKAKETDTLEQVKDENGKTVYETIVRDGVEVRVPKLKTADGKPYVYEDVDQTVTSKASAKNVKDDGTGAKLLSAQEQNIFEGAKKAAEESKSPAAKQAFEKITKDYGRGNITKERYLELLKGVPKITGKAQSPQDIARVEKAAESTKANKVQREKDRIAMLEKKYGKGFTTRAGEGYSTEFVPADVPTSQLKGRKWVRDKDGKLVLEKK
jgi:hypothetical protein